MNGQNNMNNSGSNNMNGSGSNNMNSQINMNGQNNMNNSGSNNMNGSGSNNMNRSGQNNMNNSGSNNMNGSGQNNMNGSGSNNMNGSGSNNMNGSNSNSINISNYFDLLLTDLTSKNILNESEVQNIQNKIKLNLLTKDEVIKSLETLKKTKITVQPITDLRYNELPSGYFTPIGNKIANDWDNDYSILDTNKWSVPMPRPPVCINNIPCKVCPSNSTNTVSLKDWDNSRVFTNTSINKQWADNQVNTSTM
jgi:hypothetical protein